MPKVNLEPGSVPWLSFRRNHITATDASVINGSNPFKTKSDLWKEKLEMILPDEMNERMQRGHDMEPIARELFINQTGIFMEPIVWKSDEHYWMSCSLDGIGEYHGEKLLIEIKCPSRDCHDLAKSGHIKPYYYTQMQHQFMCIGVNSGWYVSYRPEDKEEPLIMICENIDPEFCAELLIKEKEFWDQLCNFEEPKGWEFVPKLT
jgi:putative phage-type endonuclease